MNKHTRREFMAASTAAAVSLRVSDVLGAAPKKQPDLLFVMTDQQSYKMIGLVFEMVDIDAAVVVDEKDVLAIVASLGYVMGMIVRDWAQAVKEKIGGCGAVEKVMF